MFFEYPRKRFFYLGPRSFTYQNQNMIFSETTGPFHDLGLTLTYFMAKSNLVKMNLAKGHYPKTYK